MKHSFEEEPGIATLAMRAFDDAKRWVRAEIGYYTSLAGERGADVGVGIGLVIAALVVGQAALIALLVGLILTLAPYIGAGFSTLIVVVVTLVVVAILAMMAIARFRRATRPIGEEPS